MSEHPEHLRNRHDTAWVEPVNGVPLKRISWSAIFAGVIAAVLVHLLLSLLGMAIGTSSIDPMKEQNPMDGIGTGAAIWTGLSMLVSIAVGAWVSGRLAQREGMLHGLLMFGVNTLFSLWLAIMLVNSAMSGAMNVMGAGLSAIGSSISAVAPQATQMARDKLQESGINLDDLQNELETTLRQTGKPELQPENLQNDAQNAANSAQNQAQATANNPQNADTDIANWIKGVINSNQDTLQAADREALKNIIQARTGKSDAEAEQIVTQTEQTYQQARQKYNELKQQAEQKARETADKAAEATAKASWFAFFMLIIEAILAGVMGMVGRRTQPRQVLSNQRPTKRD
ncbi:hypothetical protein ACQE32_01780 [Pantoea sp. FN0302]|uniref:YrzE family protein n=1 Tax=unclassified Pantoea TaxID=2630326 RepID=UPI003CFB78FB